MGFLIKRDGIFSQLEMGPFILHVYIPCGKTFLFGTNCKYFDSVTLTFEIENALSQLFDHRFT